VSFINGSPGHRALSECVGLRSLREIGKPDRRDTISEKAMPLFGNLRIKPRIIAYRASNQRITIPKNEVLLRVRTAETTGYSIPACLEHVDSRYNWCVFGHKGETLFVKFRDGILNNTVDPEEYWLSCLNSNENPGLR
jgi:hypothetical protein